MENLTNLDPSPENELGKGLLDQATEQRLLAEGFIFAERIPFEGDYILTSSKIPIRQVANQYVLDKIHYNLSLVAKDAGE